MCTRVIVLIYKSVIATRSMMVDAGLGIVAWKDKLDSGN